MNKTYETFYQGEERAVEITIRNQDDADFIPSAAYAQVVDEDGTVVKAESNCMIVDNKIYILIEDDVTAIPGKYEIIWRIMKVVGAVSYKYYHKTALVIEEL